LTRGKTKNVLVVGETCSDIFVYGKSSRLCPDVPVPVFVPEKKVENPGMAGNTAKNLEALGIRVDLIHQSTPITKTRYVESKLNYTFLRVDEGENEVLPFDTEERLLMDYDAVVISDYGKGFLTKERIESYCSGHPNTFVDTKKRLGDWCKKARAIKINSIEFEATKDYIKLDEWVDNLIVTLGDRGCMYRTEWGFHNYPVEQVDVFDLSGAGDTFHAGLVAEYLETEDMEAAIKFANQCASEVIQKKGVAVTDVKNK
jgi:D-beta-D-heptose 7-phosphate kinase/D-beta-D-heptose 1-phosphate adenosyltransferase